MTAPRLKEVHLEYAPANIPQTALKLRSGKIFDLKDPKSHAFEIEDIVWGLSATKRFAGHTRPWMTVAEHSVNVAERTWRITGSVKAALCGLLHDAPEGLTGCDMPTPLKYALGATAVRAFEAKILAAVLARYRLTPHWPLHAESVARADRIELYTEAVLLKQDVPGGAYVPEGFVPDRDMRSFIGDPARARERFRVVFDILQRGTSPWS